MNAARRPLPLLSTFLLILASFILGMILAILNTTP